MTKRDLVPRTSADFNPKNVEQDLGRLLKGKPEQAVGKCQARPTDTLTLADPLEPSVTCSL